jgi:hypothetical protein
MAINLTTLFQSSRDAAAHHADGYGLPTNRVLTIGDRSEGFNWLTICPNPVIDLVSPRLVQRYEGVQGIEVELDDLQVQGISKAYTLDQIHGRGKFYVVGLTADQLSALVSERIDPVLIESFGGNLCDLVPGVEVEEQNQLHWSMVLRRRGRS